MADNLEAGVEKAGDSGPDGLDSTTWDGLVYLENVAGPGAIAELVDAFIRDAAPRIAHLREALVEDDRFRISKLAHDLKANAGTLGAVHLTAQARRMEECATELSSDELDSLIQEAEEESLRAAHVIRARLRALQT